MRTTRGCRPTTTGPSPRRACPTRGFHPTTGWTSGTRTTRAKGAWRSTWGTWGSPTATRPPSSTPAVSCRRRSATASGDRRVRRRWTWRRPITSTTTPTWGSRRPRSTTTSSPRHPTAPRPSTTRSSSRSSSPHRPNNNSNSPTITTIPLCRAHCIPGCAASSVSTQISSFQKSRSCGKFCCKGTNI
ncbi:hypothetical protein AAG570_010683 [Ranatra chinensis]|uniref:Uncharacterized protein n=1 Tax=Ranatra chinensis TaxID=642074 RepID=A0ABD0YNA9_9HEMI